MLLDLLQTQIWALDPRYYHMAKSIILARLDQGLPALDESLVQPRRVRTYFEGTDVAVIGDLVTSQDGIQPEARVAYRTAQVAGSSAGQVAVIPIMGTMTKRSDYCATGTAEIAQAIQQAYMDPNVSAIVLHKDSGGGSVDGTEHLGDVVGEQRKPIVTFVDGLSASASLWVASRSNHIMMSSKTTAFIGSIGVLAMHIDQSAFLEKMGTKVTIIRSSRAVDKARMNSVEPLTDELMKDYVAQLDTIHDTFIQTVKTGRAKVLGKDVKLSDSLFTGKVYNGQQALANRLADSIGTLSDAIRMADSLARKRQRQGTGASAQLQPTTTPMMKNLLALIAGKPAVTAEEQPTAEQEPTTTAQDQADESELSEEQLAQADEQIGALRIRVADQEATITQLNTTLAERDKDLATAAARVTELEASYKTLEATNTTLAAENTQLAEWKKNSRPFSAKQQDESNKTDGPPKVAAPWEVKAAAVQEKAHKRSK